MLMPPNVKGHQPRSNSDKRFCEKVENSSFNPAFPQAHEKNPNTTEQGKNYGDGNR